MIRFLFLVSAYAVACTAAAFLEHGGRAYSTYGANTYNPYIGSSYYDRNNGLSGKVNPYARSNIGYRYNSQNPQIRITQQHKNADANGYEYSYDTENQIHVSEEAVVASHGPHDHSGTRARGEYQYVDPEGNLRRVEYTADENGFRPVTSVNRQYDNAGSAPALLSRSPVNYGAIGVGPLPRAYGTYPGSGVY